MGSGLRLGCQLDPFRSVAVMQNLHCSDLIHPDAGRQAERRAWSPSLEWARRRVAPLAASLRSRAGPGTCSPAAGAIARWWRLDGSLGPGAGVGGGRPAPADELGKRIPAAAAFRHRLGCMALPLSGQQALRCLKLVRITEGSGWAAGEPFSRAARLPAAVDAHGCGRPWWVVRRHGGSAHRGPAGAGSDQSGC